MVVYLIQHAEAKSKEEDPDRGLTDDGIAAATKIAGFFSEQSPVVDAIWHSNKKRARQTAEILADALGCQDKVSEHAGLAPKDDVSPVAQELASFSKEAVVLVGHMPFVSRLASKLLAGHPSAGHPDKELVKFRNAGIVCILEDQGAWKLGWMITPALI